MSLTIVENPGGGEPMFTLTEKLWLTASMDSVVPDGDPAAKSLLGSAGKKIPMAQAVTLGLVGVKVTVETEEEDLPEFYEDMTLDQLRRVLKDRDLPVSGTKTELVRRLATDDETNEAE